MWASVPLESRPSTHRHIAQGSQPGAELPLDARESKPEISAGHHFTIDLEIQEAWPSG